MNRTFALATVALATLGSASAALFTETFTAVSYRGPYDGVIGTGSFTYDSDLVPETGDFWLYPRNGLTVTFTLLDQTFHETDDYNFDVGPSLGFSNGMPLSFSLNLRAKGAGNLVNFFDPGVERVNLGGFLLPEGEIWDGWLPFPQSPHGPYEIDMAINVDPMPEASTSAAGLLVGLGLLALRNRRARRSNSNV